MKEAQTGSACQSAGPPRAGIRQCVSGPKSLCVCVSGASSVSKQWPYRGTTLQCSGPFSVWTSPSLQPHRGNDTPVCASPRFSMSVCERGPFPTRDSRATGWAGEIGSAVMPASPGSQAYKHLSAFTLAISEARALLPQIRHNPFFSSAQHLPACCAVSDSPRLSGSTHTPVAFITPQHCQPPGRVLTSFILVHRLPLLTSGM